MSQQKQPLISVVILTKNTPFMLLKRCIQSIESQTIGRDKIELILVDMNLADSPFRAAIHEEARSLMNILRIEIQDSKEYVQGKNKALEYCHGEYITFLSANDTMSPKRLELATDYIKQHGKIAVSTNMQLQSSDMLSLTDYQMHTSTFHYLSQIVFHRDCFEMIGKFDPYLLTHSDDELWFRIEQIGMTAECNLDEATVAVSKEFYNHHSHAESAIGYRQIMTKYASYYKKNKTARIEMYRKIASSYREAGLIFRSLQFQVKCIFQ